MNVGLVRRGLPEDGAAESYPKIIAKALTTAGHTVVLFSSLDAAETGWAFGQTRIVGGATPAEFATAVESAKPRDECDFIFSIEPGVACDCLLAVTGVQRARSAQWSRHSSSCWWRLGTRHPKDEGDLLALEAKSFQPGVTKIAVAGSQMVKNEIVRHYNFPAEWIQVIRDGVPQVDSRVAFKRRHETRRQLGLAEEDFVVYCGGPGLAELEYRFEGINHTNLSQPVLLAGCDEKRWTYPRTRRTRFAGAASPDFPHLFAADLFLHPAIYDPFSHPCLAALAIGVPVITTRANGFSEIIEPGVQGEILADPSDPEAIARAIEAWSDPEKRQAAKPRLLELAAKFDSASNLKAVSALLDHCVMTCPSA